ncbi:nucleoside hydrolase [Maribellus sp. YY47]|uniref:nucleoside hydrolase n=1 Tax=Maribellus sp. YY47 TaxID=2929486 RepID=UPI0020018662|nr:nucleoside hydrolase [Maribellus sp. YY47]MCK3686018.1 nucleoside hydrolase [Maribellus sp. YY47]
MKIIIDTDANNELDDQHALAYAFLNNDVFDVVGVTVNNTANGYGLQGQYDEAKRIIQLFDLEEKLPLFFGADSTYDVIVPHINEAQFDGQAAVDFIISEAMKVKDEKLVLAPIGKLTNIALALAKEPSIANKIRIVWLGSNYPNPGEYNLVNDVSSVNPVIESGAPFEMVTVRYGDSTATDAVRVTPAEVEEFLAGKGPVSQNTITGRHGGEFNSFGNYSKDLFDHAKMHGYPPSRALFDMVVLAVLKNPAWGTKHEIPAPKLINHAWVEQPGNSQKIIYWDQFDRDAIVNDLFSLMEKTTPKQ